MKSDKRVVSPFDSHCLVLTFKSLQKSGYSLSVRFYLTLIKKPVSACHFLLFDFQDHADIEWKFARTKLWMSYFEEGEFLIPTLCHPKPQVSLVPDQMDMDTPVQEKDERKPRKFYRQ